MTKKPTLSNEAQKVQLVPHPHSGDPLQSLQDLVPFTHQEDGAPISPPISHNASLTLSWDDRDSGIGVNYSPTTLDTNAFPPSDSFSSIDQRCWSDDISQPPPVSFASITFDDAPFDDIFNPDTASSFNNPFTTMSNYNWLFDMDMSKPEQVQQPVLQDSSFAFAFNSSAIPQQPSHAFDLQIDQMNVEKSLSTAGQFGSLNSQRTDSPHNGSPSAPLLPPEQSQEVQKEGCSKSTQLIQAADSSVQHVTEPPNSLLHSNTPLDVERPMSMLVPSRSLPIIDELARQQLLDLVDITQPTAPDGSIVMRDHHLLILSCLQTYCDLFFTRFNTAYPLIHMSTFDPSEVDTLLLMSVLLLGATYAEKDSHQLAVRYTLFINLNRSLIC